MADTILKHDKLSEIIYIGRISDVLVANNSFAVANFIQISNIEVHLILRIFYIQLSVCFENYVTICPSYL